MRKLTTFVVVVLGAVFLIGGFGVPSYGEVWKDMDFPLVQGKVGILDKPDFDFTEHGYLFPQNDTSEILYLSRQLNHDYKYSSSSFPHLHYHQTTATAPTWKMDLRITENGTTPGGFATYTATGSTFTYVSGTLLQIATWNAIDWSAIDTVSAIVDIKLYRDDNVVSGDVLAKSFDFHIQIDGPGSTLQYTK